MWPIDEIMTTTFSAAYLAAAVAMYLAAPRRTANRLLAIIFVLEPIMFGAQYVLHRLLPDPGHAFGLRWMFVFAAPAWSALYLVFLGTLPSRWSAWLRRPVGIGLVSAYPLVIWTWALVSPEHFMTNVDGAPAGGPFYEALRLPILALMLYAFIVAVSAWRRSPPSSAMRSRLGIYTVAFGARDLLVTLYLVFALGLLPLELGTMRTVATVLSLLPAIAFLPVFTYGVLKYQLFDIDLKIKWTLNRGTVAAVFFAVFLVATEGAQVMFGQRNPWLGIAAAALLAFSLAPLQRLADRISDAAMPRVQDTEEYRTVRKREVYQAAVASALVDGQISDKERDVLATLAQELGLGPKDALDLERSLSQPGRS